MWENTKNIWIIEMIFIILFEILFLLILDDTRENKYKYANFYFYGGSFVKNLSTSNIIQKGNWIIVEDTTSSTEHRFRIKDIEKVEYKNQKSE